MEERRTRYRQERPAELQVRLRQSRPPDGSGFTNVHRNCLDGGSRRQQRKHDLRRQRQHQNPAAQPAAVRVGQQQPHAGLRPGDDRRPHLHLQKHRRQPVGQGGRPGVIFASGFIPYVGPYVSFALGSADAIGAFDGFYKSFDTPGVPEMYLSEAIQIGTW